jgi:WD40 repeat protein
MSAEQPRTDAFGNPLPEGALLRFGDMRWRHGNIITASALSPDGKLLATASNYAIALWDVRTGKRLHALCRFRDGDFYTSSLIFSADGRHLGTVHGEFACVWNAESGKEVLRLTRDWRFGFSRCFFTPDGKEFAVVDRERVFIHDLASAKRTRSVPVGPVHLFSPDGKTCVRVRQQTELIFSDLRTGEEKARWDVATEQNGSCNGLAFSQDGKNLAVVHQNQEIQIRTPFVTKVRARFPVPDTAKHGTEKGHWEYTVGFSPDGKTLHLATHAGTVHRWDLATGKELPVLKGHQGRAVGCHPLPDGKTVLTTGDDGLIRRWDAATGRELGECVGYAGRTHSAYSPDGRFAAVGDARGRLDLWDAKTGKRLQELRHEGKAVLNLAFAPDCKTLAVGLSDGELHFWDVPSGREGNTLRWPAKQNWTFAHTLRFSPDGRSLIVSEYPNHTWLWEIATDKVVWRGEGECASALSPDGATLATASVGPWVHFRDTATGEERGKFRLNSTAPERLGSVITALAFAPDGRRVAVAVMDGNVHLCDAPSGDEARQFLAVTPSKSRFAHHFGHGNYVSSLAFSPDGRCLLTAGSDDLVRVWEVATGAEVLRRAGHEGRELQVAYGPGGRTALSSASDGQAYLWDLRPASLSPTPLEKLWDALAAEPREAYRAVWALSEAKGAAKLLRARIAPVPPLDADRLKKLIGDLNSDRFKVRNEATRALAELGELAGPAMEEALKKKPALEIGQRLQRLLGSMKRDSSPADLSRTRAVQALELASTAEARAVLRDWSAGAPGARLTEDARAALARLGDMRK